MYIHLFNVYFQMKSKKDLNGKCNVAYFNLALVHFYERKYNEAIEILSSLYDSSDTLGM